MVEYFSLKKKKKSIKQTQNSKQIRKGKTKKTEEMVMYFFPF